MSRKTDIFTVVEVRQKVTPTRYRIPDIAVLEGEPEEEVPSIAPLLAIEILSPDDRIGYVVPKLEEYVRWGVRSIWVVDPEDRKLFTYGKAGLHEVSELSLSQYEIVLTKKDVFEAA